MNSIIKFKTRLCHVKSVTRWTVLQSTTMATARLDIAGIVEDGKNLKQVGCYLRDFKEVKGGGESGWKREEKGRNEGKIEGE